MEAITLLGTVLGLAFVAGIRLYATIFAIGFGIRAGLIHLDPHLTALEVLADPMIIFISGMLYFVEFFADKVPWFDSLWDAVHTVIRPLGAAILGATALGRVDPALALAAALLCGAVALTGHTAKAGTRLLINHSPEPFTNIAASLGEDVFSLFAVWLSLAHPVAMLGVLALFLFLFAWLAPKLYRVVHRSIAAIVGWVRGDSGQRPTGGTTPAVPSLPPPALS